VEHDEVNSESCVFCAIAKDLPKFKEKKGEKGGKNRWIGETKHFFVMLDLHPKITGHTLIISKRPANDITELTDDESRDLGQVLVDTTKLLKQSLKADKVYVMSMCEHWESKEINPEWENGQRPPNKTEHFHIQLLPRYEEMRTKETAQENMFMRPQDYGCTIQMLELVRKQIAKNIRYFPSFITSKTI
jgi:diadenosine tetraphosphate (Ap4A) HIT family hydrolase